MNEVEFLMGKNVAKQFKDWVDEFGTEGIKIVASKRESIERACTEVTIRFFPEPMFEPCKYFQCQTAVDWKKS